MTLDSLQGVLGQLEAQHQQTLANLATAEKPVIAHCNCVELQGAMQLVKQLIQMEQAALLAPPGAMGPTL